MMSSIRSPALDGVRALAILWVIPHNSDVFPDAHGFTWPFSVLAHSGWIGVQLFFVLSGFLITGNLLDSRNSHNYYQAFFGRRVLRIFPLYFTTLIFFLLVLPAITHLSPEILATYHTQGWLWVFLNNWTQPLQGTVYWFSHFWSLAVEEQFYLLWPLVIAHVASRRLPWVCGTLIVIALLSRIALLLGGADSTLAYMFTICRMDALAAGALAAVIMRDAELRRQVTTHARILFWTATSALLAGALVTNLYSTNNQVTIAVGYTVLAFALAILVFTGGGGFASPATQRLRALLSARWLGSVGKYSFGMYVFHIPISLALESRLVPRLMTFGPVYPLLYSAIILVLSYAAALVSYELMEKHFLRLKRYFAPREA